MTPGTERARRRAWNAADWEREHIERRELVVRDGTRIGYQLAGSRDPAAPCVVLANGLGGTVLAFRYVIDMLPAHRVVCWDYRGLYSSSAPADPRANTVVDQVEDLIEILDHEHIGDVVLVGWSMGVQVGFELIRRHRARVRGMLAVNGTYGRAFHTVMGSELIGRIVPGLIKIIQAQAALVQTATRAVAGSQALITAMTRAGLASDTIDRDVFRALAAGFQAIDWKIYGDLLTRLDEHDAEAVLSTIDIPFAIVTGDRDRLTPPSTADRMHRAINGARLAIIEGGTHYTPVEYPDIVCDELRRLLARVPGWELPA